MRVALVHYSAPPVVGGVEQVLGRHAILLAADGHDVTIVAARGEAPSPLVRFERIALADSLHPAIVDLQRELEEGRVSATFEEVRDRLVDELAAPLADQDVVVCHNVASIAKNVALTAALYELATRPGGARFVLWHHDLSAAHPVRRTALHDGYPWDLLRTAWPDVVQVAISDVRRHELAGLTGLRLDEITIVPNGVDVDALLRLDPATVRLLEQFDVAGSDPLLLMPARVMPRKNIELGLRVVAAMRAQGRPAGMIVTGPPDPHATDGGYPATLLALRDSLGLGDIAWFPGLAGAAGLSDAVMGDLYRLADVLFLPSLEEGFGIPLLEAAVSRLPIVCSDLPVLREVARDDALYIGPTDDPVEVARRMTAMLDADPVARLARRTRRTSSWATIYRTTIGPLLERAALRPSRT